MEFDWYEIFNRTEFEAEGLVSKILTPVLDGIGEKEILVTKGGLTSVLCDDVFLPIGFLGENPYTRDGIAVYEDDDANVWIGFEVEE
jgi:hypothetical protein